MDFLGIPREQDGAGRPTRTRDRIRGREGGRNRIAFESSTSERDYTAATLGNARITDPSWNRRVAPFRFRVTNDLRGRLRSPTVRIISGHEFLRCCNKDRAVTMKKSPSSSEPLQKYVISITSVGATFADELRAHGATTRAHTRMCFDAIAIVCRPRP